MILMLDLSSYMDMLSTLGREIEPVGGRKPLESRS